MKKYIFIIVACWVVCSISAQQISIKDRFIGVPSNYQYASPTTLRQKITNQPMVKGNKARTIAHIADMSKTSTEGKEFWVTFLQNEDKTQSSTAVVTTKLIVAARETSNITIQNPNTGWSTTATAQAGQVLEINIPLSQAFNDQNDKVTNTGLLVTSQKEISLYSSNYVSASFDAANIYPTHLLGKEYIVATYGESPACDPEFAVLATEDNTSVTITTTRNSNGGLFTANTPKTITLNKGQVIQVQCGYGIGTVYYANDLTGTSISSSKPIAVFQGDQYCYIPDLNQCSDHIYEQAIPLQAWGTEYILSSVIGTIEDVGVVVASEDNTNVWGNGQLYKTLNKGECWYFTFSSAAPYIKADKPICCCQFIEGGQKNTDNYNFGDPSMVNMTPLQQRIDHISFSTFNDSLLNYHFVNIVAHDSVVGHVMVDGTNINNQFVTVPGNANYNVAQVWIDEGIHQIDAEGGVTAFVYGIGQYESYAYNVGCRMEAINEQYLDSIYKDLNICSTNLPYKIGSLKINKSGLYKDSTITSGHKTIYIYNAHIFNPFDSALVDTISKGEYIEWRGKKYTNACEVTQCWTPTAGCDSCYRLKVYENHEIYDTICNTGSYTFKGATKTFTITLPAMGADLKMDWNYHTTDSLHIFNLHLHLLSPNNFYREFRDTICAGQTYYFEGKTYSQSGIFAINKPTKYSCDSTVVLYLTIINKKETHITAYLCKGDYYQFGSQKITKSGQYTRIAKTQDRFGCDSTIYLTLIDKDKYIVTDTMSVCPKTSFKWRGKIFHSPGTYYDSLLTVFGCDSIFKLIAKATPTQYGKDTAYFCPGDTIKVHGRYFWYETSFNDTLTSSLNCDSVRTTYIKKRPNFHNTTKKDICEGDWYQWRGTKYNATGTYYDRFSNIYGCDSVYELQLTVHPEYLIEEHAELCFGSKYNWHGKTYTQQGIYYDKKSTKYGCDSIYKLVLTGVPTHLIQDTIDICQGSYAEFHGHKWTTPGLHYDSLKTVACGCDSIFQVLVRVHPISSSKEAFITNEGTPFKWHGHEYDADGTYIDTIKSVWGCDSICTLSLQVCRAITSMEEASICSHDRYYWRGQYYNENGTFYSKKTGKNGCDSTFMLKLHVTPTDYITTKDSVCDNNYYWHGMELTKSGFYTDTIYDPANNSCVIGQLDLKVKKTTIPTDVTVLPVCSDDQFFEISYSYQGDEPVRYSIIFDTNAQNHGFRNVVDSALNGMVGAKIPKYINGELLRPDIYHADFILENGVCDGYQKKCPIDILIRYTSSVIQQNWNDVVAVVNDKYNGGYQFSQYTWFVNNHQVEGNKPYLYQPDSWRPGDLVWANLTRVGESYSIPTCPITIQSFEEVHPHPVTITYENTNRARKMVQIQSRETGYYNLYNLHGTLLYQGEIDPTRTTTLNLSDLNTVYILQVQTNDTKTMVTKKITF